MTVLSEVSDVTYSGNGGTTTFDVPFRFLAAADLQIVLTDVNGLTATPTFTATGVGGQTGGAVTLPAAPSNGTRVYIYRDPSITQNVSFVDHAKFPAKSIETVLDRATMIEKRTRDIAMGAVHRPDGDAADMTLPSAFARANRVMGFNGAGEPTSFSPSDLMPFIDPSGITVSQFLRGLADVVAGGCARLQAAVPADPDNPDRIVLDHALTVAPGGAFETMAAVRLSLSPTQISQIRTAAVIKPN